MKFCSLCVFWIVIYMRMFFVMLSIRIRMDSVRWIISDGKGLGILRLVEGGIVEGIIFFIDREIEVVEFF